MDHAPLALDVSNDMAISPGMDCVHSNDEWIIDYWEVTRETYANIGGIRSSLPGSR